MPTYEYETIPELPGEEPERFEINHSMNAMPLQFHPETGKPVRRAISGFNMGGSSVKSSGGSHSGGCCGGSCGCHH
jgi:predicted nucleic acid-binding Zn ribbon protein